MAEHPRPALPRRDFLRTSALVAAGSWLGVACSGNDDGGPSDAGVTTATSTTPPTTTTAVPAVEGPGPATTALMDGLWDDQEALVGFPFTPAAPAQVRETTWYALGLLARDEPGDADRAVRGLRSVIDRQYDQPGASFHGSFPRTAADPPVPPPGAVEFVDFDPNWRQFIGTALAMAVLRYGDRLGPLRADAERSIELAVAGDRPDRVQPDYTNIAVLHAWLLAYTDDAAGGEALAQAIADRHTAAGAFDEYNSPTYDGVSLFGLSLWRDEPPTPRIGELGEELHAALWQSMAATYHAGLANTCGPYARSYGMDLRTYATLNGLWIWSVVGQDAAPFPALERPFDHPGDVCFGPLVDLFVPSVPDDARRHFEAFQDERDVSVGVDGAWRATSWLGESTMTGGWRGAPVRAGGGQIHPGTIHWDGGWIRVLGDVDAVAAPSRLDLTVRPGGRAVVTVAADGVRPADLGPQAWQLPGLTVTVEGGGAPVVAPHATNEGVDLELPPGAVSLVLGDG